MVWGSTGALKLAPPGAAFAEPGVKASIATAAAHAHRPRALQRTQGLILDMMQIPPTPYLSIGRFRLTLSAGIGAVG